MSPFVYIFAALAAIGIAASAVIIRRKKKYRPEEYKITKTAALSMAVIFTLLTAAVALLTR